MQQLRWLLRHTCSNNPNYCTRSSRKCDSLKYSNRKRTSRKRSRPLTLVVYISFGLASAPRARRLCTSACTRR